MGTPVIALVGATAVGKSAVAVALARRIGGEIINADSRQVYRGMAIGTGIPSEDERSGVPHHLYGISEPDDDFSLGRFLTAAKCAIQDIHERARTPIVVGGTGQYVWALLEGWNVPEVAPDPELRQQLMERAEAEGRDTLHEELRRLDPTAAELIHPNNLIRAMRALEVVRTTGRPFSEQRTQTPPPWDTHIAGVSMEREALDVRIEQRVDHQLEAGWVDEVRALLAAGYSPSLSSFRSIGYREIATHIEGHMPVDEIRQTIISKTRRFARTQFAWFRADDERITWVEADEVSERPSEQIQATLGL
ncbi:MAG: tRNA (adenosine(37)-N6)-dimethylallyltransferase MiaA [Chloroflexi bacterium]|nr:tRNA (adenosine(37)-N6)-dimethylallyltransferase MiaA [Chloroflexota bacterium]